MTQIQNIMLTFTKEGKAALKLSMRKDTDVYQSDYS